MTSSPAMASGVTITSAGGGANGVLTGNGGGLGGLFGMLMGGATASSSATPAVQKGQDDSASASVPTGGMISVMLGAKAAIAAATPNGVTLTALDDNAITGADAQGDVKDGQQVQQELQLGDAPPVMVSGNANDVAAFIKQVKAIYQQIVDSGGLTIGKMSESKQLAAALTKLGMNPDDAQGVAERIQTMLKILKDSQDQDGQAPVADTGTQGTLAAMMLAVMAQQASVTPHASATAGAQALSLQISTAVDSNASSSSTVTISPLTGQQTAAMAAWKNASAGDVTRELLGLGKTDAGTDTKVATTTVDIAQADTTQRLQVTVSKDNDASIGLALPDVKSVPVTVPQVDAKMSDAAQAATAITTTGAAVKVAADEQLQAPKGETYYKLQADKHGVETLEAVKPATESRDLTQLSQQNVQAQVTQATIDAAAVTATNTAFAERVAQIQAMVDKAQVGQQVAVQMQPLLDQGGGTVRINLHPKDLGQITIELKVADGKVHGTIAASQPEVVEQLARELHSLRHGLADAGLKLGEQGINLMLSGGNQNGQGQGQNGQQAQTGQGFAQGNTAGNGASAGAMDTGAEQLAANLSAWVSPDRVLDVNV